MVNQYEKKSNSLYGTPLEIWHKIVRRPLEIPRETALEIVFVIEEAFSVTRDKEISYLPSKKVPLDI
jgi:hypothetical protein